MSKKDRIIRYLEEDLESTINDYNKLLNKVIRLEGDIEEYNIYYVNYQISKEDEIEELKQQIKKGKR